MFNWLKKLLGINKPEVVVEAPKKKVAPKKKRTYTRKKKVTK